MTELGYYGEPLRVRDIEALYHQMRLTTLSNRIPWKRNKETPFLDFLEREWKMLTPEERKKRELESWIELGRCIQESNKRMEEMGGYWLPMHMGGYFVPFEKETKNE